ncbi:MAG: hypothetical protein A2945_03640 [Candidatus Liptonbacteria bacterium RIFCSPLOWO2_01_FULL_52_25]|uniref:Tr-type G domain-containing protein n=1 Tax=Candidatus Liptonbacteria bacterium RIFCSPLOWO2_01_FULL_52_25 TaxID=1798650 RepID=A0A1G2CG86_9BACT|nr:MAG: hypothetical protein A2945_03640 [Candidatus Liptonbacteria bacterium RIFCSPLOWO2_01_FULL_52_25]
MENIRNFVIIAHIDSGKSTLADRMLEITGTVEARSMRPQYLDKLDLERERGITIKMAPVRMLWHPDRGITRTDTQNNAESDLLYEDLTYKIRGAAFEVRKRLGLGHKESVYRNALTQELSNQGLQYEAEKNVGIFYDGKKVGSYQPDFIVGNKVIVELKALPEIGRPQTEQLWSYLKGSEYKLALLVNFGSKDLEIKRVVYDTARLPRPSASIQRDSAEVEYILNLIDTPGHSDFSYEVSRALNAVEGAILLIDGTKGIQAQTLSNLRAARRAGLTIVGAVNKTDLDLPQLPRIIKSAADLLGVNEDEIFRISAKTGHGVAQLLEEVIKKVPPPRTYADSTQNNAEKSPRESASSLRQSAMPSKALTFDSLYDDHKGILAFVRAFDGEFKAGDEVTFLASGAKFKIKEVGYFVPETKASQKIGMGEIGYVATGLKEPAMVKIGDTLLARTNADLPAKVSAGNLGGQARTDAEKSQRVSASGQRESANLALPGYQEVAPVVFISFYPDGATKFEDLKKGLERLRLTDAALSFEPDANEALGRGMKVGFLGQLHFEIAASRLKDEFNLEFLTSFPSIAYRVLDNGIKRTIKQPQDFPEKPEKVWQPMIKVEILVPEKYLSQVLGLKNVFDLEVKEIENLGENLLISGRMPLAELIRDFDDRMKSVSAGFASFIYELDGEELADVEKLEIVVVGDVVAALTRIVQKKDLEHEGRATVERLKELLPKEQFSQALQAKAAGRIIARETIPAMKKALGDFGKNGGDRTRKMKLWKKQQRGKERLQSMARVELSPEVFREILKK